MNSPIDTIYPPKRELIRDSLEAVLAELARYGKPKVGVYGSGGWHCSIDLSTTSAGVGFSVASQFDHKTPLEAAIVCRTRMLAALDATAKGKV